MFNKFTVFFNFFKRQLSLLNNPPARQEEDCLLYVLLDNLCARVPGGGCQILVATSPRRDPGLVMSPGGAARGTEEKEEDGEGEGEGFALDGFQTGLALAKASPAGDERRKRRPSQTPSESDSDTASRDVRRSRRQQDRSAPSTREALAGEFDAAAPPAASPEPPQRPRKRRRLPAPLLDHFTQAQGDAAVASEGSHDSPGRLAVIAAVAGGPLTEEQFKWLADQQAQGTLKSACDSVFDSHGGYWEASESGTPGKNASDSEEPEEPPEAPSPEALARCAPDSETLVVDSNSNAHLFPGLVPALQQPLRALCAKRAFAENGEYVALPEFSAQVLRNLTDRGVLVQRDPTRATVAHGGSGDPIADAAEIVPEYSLRLEAIRVSAIIGCVDAELLAKDEAPMIHFTKWPKLVVIQHLCRTGWTPREDANVGSSLLRDGALEFPVRAVLHQPASYFHVLVKSAAIFSETQELQFVLHRGYDSYYQCLLRLPELGPLAEMTEAQVTAIGDQEFKRMLKSGGAMPAPEPIDDGEEDAMLPIEDQEEQEGEAPAPARVAPPQRIRPVLQNPPPRIILRPNDEQQPTIRVTYDNCSHTGHGKSRAFVTCKYHDNCSKNSVVKSFTDKTRCEAWLVAWVLNGKQFKDRLDTRQHASTNPPPALVESVYQELRHGDEAGGQAG